MRRPLALAAVLASIASVLAGCAGVPTSGPIEQGPSIAAPGNDQFIRVIARPPVDGMTPEEVVRGFQEATASQDTGFGVAKQYLTTVAATTWNPGKGVSIYDTSGLTFDSAGADVSAVGRLTGEIDRTGQYTVAAPGAQLAVDYRLARVDGQWRINALPDGLVLGRGDIDRGYRAFNLYYFTRDSATLVPAPVMLPLSNAGVATRLVSSLLAGPTPWIAPSVRSGFPEGTVLVPESVPVVDGIADVALSDAVLAADDQARQALSAQLVWTLRQLPDISGVRITVNGRPLLVPGVGTTQSMTDWLTYDPDAVPDTFTAYARSQDDRFLRVGDDRTLAPVLTPDPRGVLPGVSLEGSDVAWLSPSRRRLYVAPLTAGSSGTLRYTGTELSRPSWDRTGDVWVVDRGRGLLLVSGDAEPVVVPVSGLPDEVEDSDLVAAAVSRDGTRMALLVQRGSRTEPVIARIERTGDRVRVAAPRRVDSQLTESLDLAWADSGTLAVLGASGRTSLEVVQFSVGTTRARRLSAPEGSVSVAAGPSRALLAGTAEALFTSVGASWNRLADATDPVYPG
jgi:hypothetical protein